MEFRKVVTTILYARKQKRHRCKNRILDYVGGGEGGMIWEKTIEIFILSFVKQMSNQVWWMKQGIQSLCSEATQRDGVGQEVGRGFRMEDHRCTHGWFMLMYGKTRHNIVK